MVLEERFELSCLATIGSKPMLSTIPALQHIFLTIYILYHIFYDMSSLWQRQRDSNSHAYKAGNFKFPMYSIPSYRRLASCRGIKPLSSGQKPLALFIMLTGQVGNMANGLGIEPNTVGFGDQLATLEHDRIFNKTNYLHSFISIQFHVLVQLSNLKYISCFCLERNLFGILYPF